MFHLCVEVHIINNPENIKGPNRNNFNSQSLQFLHS